MDSQKARFAGGIVLIEEQGSMAVNGRVPSRRVFGQNASDKRRHG